MEKVIKKYTLSDKQQEEDDKQFWQNKSIAYKMQVLESLRRDAYKLGLYPNQTEDGSEQRLRRVLRITKQK